MIGFESTPPPRSASTSPPVPTVPKGRVDVSTDAQDPTIRPTKRVGTSLPLNPLQEAMMRSLTASTDQAHRLRHANEALAQAVNALLETRDFMGYQLDLAYENLTEEEFNGLAERYLYDACTYDPTDLARRVRVLFDHVRDMELLDAHTIALLFRCSIEQAEAAWLKAVLQAEG